METKKEHNELPVKISRKNFNRYIRHYLSVGKRGPETKISLYKIFNYILQILYTGCQWTALVIRKKEISWQAVYAHHNRWSKDGSYEAVFENSVDTVKKEEGLDLSILHGDGSNTVAKKGAKKLVIPVISIKKAKKKWL